MGHAVLRFAMSQPPKNNVTAFGDAYRQYCARTKRFLPGVY